MSVIRILALLIILTFSVHIQADTVNYSGETLDTGLKFNRPTDTGTALSSIASNVPYDFYKVTVGTAGSYTFSLQTTETNPDLFDTFLILYSPTFDKNSPLNNFIVANDNTVLDTPTSGSSFSQTLAPGTDYFLVITGFDNDAYGKYAGTITGPGTISVPEPQSYALLAMAGLAFLVLRFRGKIARF